MNIQANRLYNHCASHFPLYLILIGNIIFLQFNAFRHFNFYDMPFLLDGGWRLLNGQRPYVDFYYVTGPIHLYMNALFFGVFGFGKTAILSHLVFGHSIVIIAMYLLARKYLPVGITILLTILTTTSFYWPISHPWHNQTAHMWSIIALTIFIFQTPFKNTKSSFVTAAVMGFLVMLSLMTKTNTGGIYGLLFLIILLSSTYRLQAFGGYCLGVFIGLIVTLILVGAPAAYIEQMRMYSQMILGENRVARLMIAGNWFINYYWIPFFIVLINAAEHWKHFKELFLLFVGMYPLIIFTVFSSDILVSANIFLWGVFMTLGFILIYKVRLLSLQLWQIKLWKVSNILLILTAVVLIGLSAKYGYDLKVWTYSGKDPVGNYALKSKPLEGWLCDRRRGEHLDGLAAFINNKVPKNDTLLVVTDFQILYALTGRQSFKRMPLFIIEENRMPIPHGQAEIVREGIKQNPPDWVVTDMASFLREIPYLGLLPLMKIRYRIAGEFGPYAIFRRVL